VKEEALDRTMWRAGFGRGFGPIVRQIAKRINELYIYIYIYLKVKCSHYRPGVAQRVALEGGEWSAASPGRTLPP